MRNDFHNTILPKAQGADVCEAISKWLTSEGFEPQTRRLPYSDYDYGKDERRFVVLWNKEWCVVLQDNDHENAAGLRWSLREFPAVIQLWSKHLPNSNEYGWGYRLEEYGKRTTSYCSKHGLETLDEPLARTKSDLKRLTTVCGRPNALRKLRRLEGYRLVSSNRLWAKFADALDVPAAILNFFDVDLANAGLLEERTIDGWHLRMLAFRRPTPTDFTATKSSTNDKLLLGEPATLTPAERRKPLIRKLFLLLLIPFGMLLGLFVFTGFFVLLGIFLAGAFLQQTPYVRRAFTTRLGRFWHDFPRQVAKTVPNEIQINGELVTNTRHQCTIVVRPPAKAFPKVLPLKGRSFSNHVFDIEIGELFLTCEAFTRSGKPWQSCMNTLEEREFSAGGFVGHFQKLTALHQDRSSFYYEWTLDVTSITYQFRCSQKAELTSEQVAQLETIVCSFRSILASGQNQLL